MALTESEVAGYSWSKATAKRDFFWVPNVPCTDRRLVDSEEVAKKWKETSEALLQRL